jgi:hypothetical protein
MTVTTLGVLWAVGLLAYPLSALAFGASRHWTGIATWAALGTAGLAALVSAVMAFGLMTRAGWARYLQMGLAVLGILSCAFLLPSALILWYMLRRETVEQFEGRSVEENPSLEAMASIGIVATSALPLLVAGLLLLLPSLGVSGLGRGTAASVPGTVDLRRMRAVAAAEQAFSSGTCGTFADMDGLLHPASIIPNYPAGGPAFLAADGPASDAAGYRYDLQVDDPAAPADGCPSRSFRRFLYSATPADAAGRHYVVGADGLVRMAEGRPASPSDPPAEER